MQHNWIVKKKKPAGRHTRSQKRADSAASGWSMQSHGQEQTWQAWGQETTAGKYHITQATIWHWTKVWGLRTHRWLVNVLQVWLSGRGPPRAGQRVMVWQLIGGCGVGRAVDLVLVCSRGVGDHCYIVLYNCSTYQMQFNYKNFLIILTASKWKKSNMTQPQR